MTSCLLSVSGATKDYNVRVLDHVDFDLSKGEIHALVGANGAGKSTLCKIIAGLIPATSGSMQLEGQPYAPTSKRDGEAAGVQIVQQELNLIGTLTVAENLLFGRLPAFAGVIRRSQLRSDARAALDRFGLPDIDGDAMVSQLGVGQQQMLEIAAALDRESRLLILDEPTAALGAEETERLYQWLDQIRKRGVGIIYISHRLDEIARLADRVTVLRDGRLVTTRNCDGFSTDQMIASMSGEDVLSCVRNHHSMSTDRVRLRVQGLTRGDVVNDVNFVLHAGERLGIAGLVGSGRTELLRVLFGADRADAGSLWIDDDPTPIRFTQPRDAVSRGLAMVTEDRKQNGLLLALPIRTNLTIGCLPRLAIAGVIRPASERSAAENLREDLEIRCTSTEQLVRTLSGGNQQKVAVGKWLLRRGDIYLFDEPTRGIDVAARARIYRLFDALAEQGKSLLVVSSDVDELLETCDRILVMSAGRIVAHFDRHHWSRDAIIEASFAGYRDSATQGNEAVT